MPGKSRPFICPRASLNSALMPVMLSSPDTVEVVDDNTQDDHEEHNPEQVEDVVGGIREAFGRVIQRVARFKAGRVDRFRCNLKDYEADDHCNPEHNHDARQVAATHLSPGIREQRFGFVEHYINP